MRLEPQAQGARSCCADLGRSLALSELGYSGGGKITASLSCLGPRKGSVSTVSDAL